jgi:hypothetical protein
MTRFTDHLVRPRLGLHLALHLVALPLVAGIVMLGGCNSSAPTPTPSEDEPAVAAEPVAAEAQTGAPKIAADEPVFEFGSIKPTDKVEHVFKIRNAGTADLKIERVQRT